MIEYEEDGYLIREHDDGMVERLLIGEAPAARPLTSAELIDRFTDDELGEMNELTVTNKKAAGWMKWLLAQPFLALDHPRLTDGMARMVTAGALTQERVDQILAAA